MVQRFGNGDSPTWFIGLPAVHAQVSCQTPRSSTDAAPPHPAWAVQLPRTILLPANGPQISCRRLVRRRCDDERIVVSAGAQRNGFLQKRTRRSAAFGACAKTPF